MSDVSRRAFLSRTFGALAAALPLPRLRFPAGGSGPGHPTPRPGITAARVLTREELADTPGVIPVFDQVREIPGIVDGIRCNCGCADLPGFYSLLSCYEGDGMARSCPVCQGQGRMTYRLNKEGKTLDEIREAIDARYG